jgi:hypothetical protein
MINCTAAVVLALRAHELDSAIRNSLEHAADALLQAYGCVHIDLRTITTKTNPTVAGLPTI